MDEIIFDGKTYTRARALAKEFKYTSDYLGQLCRAGKVDARLVGRTWFVTRASLEEHRAQRYEAQRTLLTKPVSSEIHSEITLSRIDVPPVQSKHLRKHFYEHQVSQGTIRVPGSTRYEPDKTPLVPLIRKPSVVDSLATTTIPVALSEAVPVTVKQTGRKSTAMRSEPLPTVYLRGAVPVQAVVESDDKTLQESQEPADEIAVSNAKPVTRSRQRRLAHLAPQHQVTMVASPAVLRQSVSERPVVTVPIRPLEVIVSRPVAISVVVGGVVALLLIGLQVVVDISSLTGVYVRWHMASVWPLF